MSQKLHCPICLNELDKNGDCWPVCEYESSHAKAGFEPLTRKQALEKFITKRKVHINAAYAALEKQKLELATYEKELEILVSTPFKAKPMR